MAALARLACTTFVGPACAFSLSRVFIISPPPKVYSTRSLRLVSSVASVEPPNISDLCEKARLSLTAEEVSDVEPQLVQIAEWFSQLQGVDIEDVIPAVRAGDLEDGSSLRKDVPNVFIEREAMLSAAPEVQGPFLKVPKILKENMEQGKKLSAKGGE